MDNKLQADFDRQKLLRLVKKALRDVLWLVELPVSVTGVLIKRWLPLILAVIAYKQAYRFGIEPMTLADLAALIAEMDETLLAALLGSLVTVIGFFAAFATAHSSWKAQQRMLLFIQCAAETNEHFQLAADSASTLESYARKIIRLRQAHNEGVVDQHLHALLIDIFESSNDARIAATRLRRAHLSTYPLQRKYELVLSQIAPGLAVFDQAADHLKTLSDNSYFFIASDRQSADENIQMLTSSQLSDPRHYVSVFEEMNVLMLGKVGALQGALYRPLLKWRIYTLIRMVRSVSRTGRGAEGTMRSEQAQQQ